MTTSAATTLVPSAGMLLLAAATFAWFLADAVTGARAQVREWRRRDDDELLAETFEDYGLYWPVSPPSHAAGRAA